MGEIKLLLSFGFGSQWSVRKASLSFFGKPNTNETKKQNIESSHSKYIFESFTEIGKKFHFL
jgi:hypothetical protein